MPVSRVIGKMRASGVLPLEHKAIEVTWRADEGWWNIELRDLSRVRWEEEKNGVHFVLEGGSHVWLGEGGTYDITKGPADASTWHDLDEPLKE